jgi:UDP-3-O-[3-hydroxymyristoyl] glucosamine N-acyltransferase
MQAYATSSRHKNEKLGSAGQLDAVRRQPRPIAPTLTAETRSSATREPSHSMNSAGPQRRRADMADGAAVINRRGFACPKPTARLKISFFANPKYTPLLRKTRASAVFVPVDFSEAIAAAQIRVADPGKAFEQVVLSLAPPPIRFASGIHPTAVVAPDAILGEGVSIQPHAVIEAGAAIGAIA